MLTGIALGLEAGAFAEEEIPPLASFPQNERLWLNVAKGSIGPSQSKIATTNTAGDFKILVDDGQSLKKGEVWAIAKPTRLELAHETLILDERAADEQMELMELDHLDSIATNADKLASLKSEAAKLKAAATSLESNDDPELKRRLREAANLLSEDISRMERRHELLKQKKAYATEMAGIELDLKKQRNEYEEIRRTSEFTAPFDCTVALVIEDIDPAQTFPATLWLDSGVALASLTNEKAFSVRVPAISPELSKAPQDSLFVVINPANLERRIEAGFSHTEPNPNNPLAAQTMVFEIPEDDHAMARELQGNQSLAHVYCRLPQGCRLVSKKVLTKLLADQPDQLEWPELVDRLWPDAKIIAVGRRAIAIQPPA